MRVGEGIRNNIILTSVTESYVGLVFAETLLIEDKIKKLGTVVNSVTE
jgi:hypothetical protein